MKQYKIVHVVGARPNFMKLSPVFHALEKYRTSKQLIVHTGQHYDCNMSDVFFRELELPMPEINLGIQEKTALKQIGRGILEMEDTILQLQPDLVVVYGDVNATAFAAIVCSKMGIKLAHIEAGLRSFDRSMPEETNRVITDALADYFFTPSQDADENLLREGIPADRIFFTGNVMIDTLVKFLPKASEFYPQFNVPSNYGLVTLHRPSNVDDPERLKTILAALHEIAAIVPILFPVHPRTRRSIPTAFLNKDTNLRYTGPLGYLEFLKLQQDAAFIITDSGGVQEESTYLGVPCFTLRKNTERPVTITCGTNVLIGENPVNAVGEVKNLLAGNRKKCSIPPLWDGRAGERIAGVIIQKIFQENVVDISFS